MVDTMDMALLQERKANRLKMALLYKERQAKRLERKASRRLSTGGRALIARAPRPSEDRNATDAFDKNRLNAAHMQQLAALVPRLGLKESLPSGSTFMDGDQDDRIPLGTRQIPASPLQKKFDAIEDMMKQAQTSLSSKEKHVNEGSRNVSLESKDRFAPTTGDGKPGIPAIDRRGPPRPETVQQSKAEKKENSVASRNSVTSSPGSVDPADDMQADDFAAPMVIDLSMFDDLDQLLNQLLNDTIARTEVYEATTGKIGIVEDPNEEETDTIGRNEVKGATTVELGSVKDPNEEETDAIAPTEVYGATRGNLGIVEDPDEEVTPSKSETKEEVTKKHDAFKESYTSSTYALVNTGESDEEETHSVMETRGSTSEEPYAFEETYTEESPGENETRQDNKEAPDLTTDMDEETMEEESVYEESVYEIEISNETAEDFTIASVTDEETGDERAEKEVVNENEISNETAEDVSIATDIDEKTGDETLEEELVNENETLKDNIEDPVLVTDMHEEMDDETAEDETVYEGTVYEIEISNEPIDDATIATEMDEETGYDSAEDESINESETSNDNANIAPAMDKETGYYTAEEESINESETSSEAAEDAEDADVTDADETGDETVEDESVSESEANKEATEDPDIASDTDDETRDETAEEDSVNEYYETSKEAIEDPDGAEETDEETDKEESSIEGASTTEEVLEEPKVVSAVAEETEPRNIEVKQTEAEDPWKNLDDVLQTDEEETFVECDEQEYESDDNDSVDDPESDFSVMAIDFVVDFAGIVETLSEEFSDLLPGRKSSKRKNKFKFQDFVNDTAGHDEANLESQRLTENIAVLATNPSPESKVYVQWDKNDVGKGLIASGNKDHSLHVESDLSSLTAAATTSADPGVAGKRLTTSFYLANRSLLSEDNEEEQAASRAQKWMCCT